MIVLVTMYNQLPCMYCVDLLYCIYVYGFFERRNLSLLLKFLHKGGGVAPSDSGLAMRPIFCSYGLRNGYVCVCGPCHSPPEAIHMHPLHTRL